MTRRPLGALALSLVLLAGAASPAHADTAAPDPAFSGDGYAFSSFDQSLANTTPRTIAAPDGTTATAVILYQPMWLLVRGERAQTGLLVIRRAADGTEIGRTLHSKVRTFEAGELFDMRFVGGDLLIAGWFKDFDETRNPPRHAFVVTEREGADGFRSWDRPSAQSCTDPSDGAIFGDGRVAFSWNCDEIRDLRVYDPATENEPAAADPDALDNVMSIARDPQDRIVLQAFRGGETGGALLQRLVRDGTSGFAVDPTFGGGEPVATDTESNDLVVDALSRPVLAEQWDGNFIERRKANGTLDESFGGDGRVDVESEDLSNVNAFDTDDQRRVVAVYRLDPNRFAGRALVRLLENGTPDESFGPGGIRILDQESGIGTVAPPVGLGGATYFTFSIGDAFGGARGRVPASPTPRAIAVLKVADPRPPEPKKDEPIVVTQPPAAAVPPPPVVQQQPSRSRQLRTCLSRRSFSIRLRPKSRKIVRATVTVAGRKARTRIRNGRMTATIDLRRLRQSTFTVKVVATDARGRTSRESRTYRTCRVGEDGPKVKGGSTVINIG